MSTYSPTLTIAFAVIALLCASATGAQEKEAFFLPRDDQSYDDITVRGVRERRLLSGLSRLIVPDSDTAYYVIDERNALQRHLFEAFADIWRNDSDIGIGYDQFRTEFIHFRLRPDTQDVRYFKLEPALLLQTSEFFRDGGFSSPGGSIEFLEYQMRIDSCANLGAALERMQVMDLCSTRFTR